MIIAVEAVEEHRLFAREPLLVERRGRGVRSGIADGQYRDGDEVVGQLVGLAHLRGVEVADPRRAEAERRGFEHHLRRDDGRVHRAHVAVVERALPARLAVVADEQRERRVKVVGRAALELFKRLGAFEHEHALRLVVHRGRRAAPRFEYRVELFALDLLVGKFSYRVTFLRKFEKIHFFVLPSFGVPLQ